MICIIDPQARPMVKDRRGGEKKIFEKEKIMFVQNEFILDNTTVTLCGDNGNCYL